MNTTKLRDISVVAACAVAVLAMSYNTFVKPYDTGRIESVDAVALGREFGPMLSVSLADGFEAGASVLEAPDGTVAAGIEKQKQVAEAAKDAAFEKRVGPAFALIVPDGEEDTSQTKRSALARLWRDFARGLRKAK